MGRPDIGAGHGEPKPPVTVGRVVSPASDPASSAPASSVRLRPDGAAEVEALAGTDMAQAELLASAGWTAYQRGDLESALDPLMTAARALGARPWVYYALGLTQAGLRQPRDAVASWERVRAVAPAFKPAYIDLAATYAHLSDLTSALEWAK